MEEQYSHGVRQRQTTLLLPGEEFIKKTDEFLCRALSGELGEAADVSKENTERRRNYGSDQVHIICQLGR